MHSQGQVWEKSGQAAAADRSAKQHFESLVTLTTVQRYVSSIADSRAIHAKRRNEGFLRFHVTREILHVLPAGLRSLLNPTSTPHLV